MQAVSYPSPYLLFCVSTDLMEAGPQYSTYLVRTLHCILYILLFSDQLQLGNQTVNIMRTLTLLLFLLSVSCMQLLSIYSCWSHDMSTATSLLLQ